jgi:DNA gyrase inhibitor GyrI
VYAYFMTWQEIQQLHPKQWLLLEVLKAESNNKVRYLTNLAVLERFEDSMSALRAYKTMKELEPQRELMVLHTDRPEPIVKERFYVGVRGAA